MVDSSDDNGGSSGNECVITTYSFDSAGELKGSDVQNGDGVSVINGGVEMTSTSCDVWDSAGFSLPLLLSPKSKSRVEIDYALSFQGEVNAWNSNLWFGK